MHGIKGLEKDKKIKHLHGYSIVINQIQAIMEDEDTSST
jgi:hypothetical protein